MERQRNPGAAFHRLSTSFVLGYRGCTKIVAERLLSGKRFKQSKNSYDWLGTGIYFWEANPARALEYVREAQVRKKLDANDVAVVGAVIDLGFCLDLLSSKSISLVLGLPRISLLGFDVRPNDANQPWWKRSSPQRPRLRRLKLPPRITQRRERDRLRYGERRFHRRKRSISWLWFL